MPVAPYPYGSWPRVSRRALTAARAWRGAMGRGALEAATHDAASLLGCPVALELGVPTFCDGTRARDLLGPVEIALSLILERGAERTPWVLSMPCELGAELVDRMLGGDGRTAHLPADRLDDMSMGVVGYLAARMAASAGSGLRVSGVHGDPRAVPDRTAASCFLLWPAQLTLAGRTWTLRALLDPNLPQGDAAPLSAATSSALRPELQLSLCAHAGIAVLAGDALDELCVGDAVFPERCDLRREGTGFVGEVTLHVSRGHRTRFMCRAHGSTLTLARIEHEGGDAMTEGKRIQAAERGAALAGDAMVEVCLELARFTLSLDELGRLAPGDALSTGKPIGAHVVLRAGGVALGEGELIEVDGEVGVRVTRLASQQKLDDAPHASD